MRLLLISAIILLTGLGIFRLNPLPLSKHKFIVIAHRGDHVIYPENTIEAYQEAIKNEADYVEIDLRTTKDSQLVSIHDATVNRTSTGTGKVNEHTLTELLQLQIKSRDTTDQHEYHIPTFAEILKLCKGRINIYLDFKDADPLAALRMIKRYGMEKQVLVYINSKEQYLGWRKVSPAMPLMLSLPGNVKDVAGMKQFIDQYEPDVLDGGYHQYSNDMVAYANSLGLPVWPDIQSAREADNWDLAISKGLTGLQTDHPKAMIDCLKKKKLR
jgi:glycerophosphoryl diester phosphodiesterase